MNIVLTVGPPFDFTRVRGDVDVFWTWEAVTIEGKSLERGSMWAVSTDSAVDEIMRLVAGTRPWQITAMTVNEQGVVYDIMVEHPWANQDEYETPWEAQMCMCGAMLPCRHIDVEGHGLLSYFQEKGPEKGGPIRLTSADDFRRARAVIDIYEREVRT